MSNTTTEGVRVLNTWLSMFGLRALIALKLKGIEYEYEEQDLQHKSKLLLESNPVHKKVPVLIHKGKPICESLIIVQYIDEAWPSSEQPFLPKDPYLEQDLQNKSKLLLESNPIHKKIPVLIHKGKPICESLIIVQYIDETWPSSSSSDKPCIFPKDPYHRAIARFWADFVDKKVYDAGMRVIKSPEGEQQEQAKKDMIEALITLDGALHDVSGGKTFFGGQDIGFVDIALAPYLCWFDAYETIGAFKLLDESKCPHLCKWAKDVLEYPCVKEAVTVAPPGKIVEFAKWLRNRALGA